jgi:hypothetical protein
VNVIVNDGVFVEEMQLYVFASVTVNVIANVFVGLLSIDVCG